MGRQRIIRAMPALLNFGFFIIGAVLTPLAILAAVFIYVRAQRGRPVDLASGLTAYTVVLIGGSAVVFALGITALLTSFMGEVDFDYTYGAGEGALRDPFGPVRSGDSNDRIDRDRARGIALILAGAAIGAVHLGLRRSLQGRDLLDGGVEAAWDVLLTVLAGLVTLGLVAGVFAQTFQRAMTEGPGPSPGGTIAAMWAFLALWAVYGWRTLDHAGIPLFARAPAPEDDEDLE
jgi:hypothetical protein